MICVFLSKHNLFIEVPILASIMYSLGRIWGAVKQFHYLSVGINLLTLSFLHDMNYSLLNRVEHWETKK